MNTRGNHLSRGRWLPTLIVAGVAAWLFLLMAVLVLGWCVHPFPDSMERFDPRNEAAEQNETIFGGVVPAPHPLGITPHMHEDQLELLLMGLSRTLTGPLVGCLVAVALGGIWGAWAGYREGGTDRLLGYSTALFDTVPRVVLFALLGRILRLAGINVAITHLVIIFVLFQIPSIGMVIRNHVRSLVREGYVEGLVSLGFSKRTIISRDLLRRECLPILRLQYVARVTELVAVETAITYALGGGSEHTVGWVLRHVLEVTVIPGWFSVLLVLLLAAYLLTLSLTMRRFGELKDLLNVAFVAPGKRTVAVGISS